MCLLYEYSFNTHKTPGEILGEGNGAITVACGSGAVAVTALQAEGKPKTDADSYLRGNRVEKGSFFTCS